MGLSKLLWCMQTGAPVEGTAEATYRQWLSRQYAAFLESLRGLVAGGAPPAVQVCLPARKLLARLPAPARAEPVGAIRVSSVQREVEVLGQVSTASCRGRLAMSAGRSAKSCLLAMGRDKALVLEIDCTKCVLAVSWTWNSRYGLCSSLQVGREQLRLIHAVAFIPSHGFFGKV